MTDISVFARDGVPIAHKGALRAPLPPVSAILPNDRTPAGLPAYLMAHYWWAYVHPRAVRLFERQWLVNLILWGHYGKLRDAALADLRAGGRGATLQVACAYGDLTKHLIRQSDSAGGTVDVIDVVPIQLANLHRKLPNTSARLRVMDSTKLRFPDAVYDSALVFFLLHEQPRHYRQQTLNELHRVVKPGGKIVIVDYARPRWWNPLRYLWRPLLRRLEPFALDLWREDIARWCPKGVGTRIEAQRFFGGLYQKLVITR